MFLSCIPDGFSNLLFRSGVLANQGLRTPVSQRRFKIATDRTVLGDSERVDFFLAAITFCDFFRQYLPCTALGIMFHVRTYDG